MALPEALETELTEAVDAVFVKGEENGDTSANQEGGADGDKESKEEKKEAAGEDDSAKGDDESGEKGGADDSAVHGDESQESGKEERDSDGDSKDSKEDGSGTGESVAESAVSDAVLSQAVLAGIPIADARSFSSDESLLRVVNAVHTARQDASKEDTGEASDEDDPLASFPELNPDDFEPETIKVFDGLKDVILKQQEAINKLRTSQQNTTEISQKANDREVEQWFDAQINSLGDDFTEALGAGGYSNQPQGSSQLAKRNQIAEQMAVMFTGYEASGLPVPSRDEIFETASHIVLRDEFTGISEKAVASKLKKRGTQHTQRASGRATNSKLDPLEETARLIDEKFS